MTRIVLDYWEGRESSRTHVLEEELPISSTRRGHRNRSITPSVPQYHLYADDIEAEPVPRVLAKVQLGNCEMVPIGGPLQKRQSSIQFKRRPWATVAVIFVSQFLALGCQPSHSHLCSTRIDEFNDEFTRVKTSRKCATRNASRQLEPEL